MPGISFIESAMSRIVLTVGIINMLVTLNEILKLLTLYLAELIYASYLN
jgi:uncharacterized membrane protein YqaE (UPF0057 family)